MVNVEYSRIDAVERRMQLTVAEVEVAMKRGLAVLASIAVTAPLLGILGACTGYVNVFKFEYYAAGFSFAFIPPALSLLVAIPSWWSYQYFTTRIESFKIEMKNGSSELLDYLIRWPAESLPVAAQRKPQRRAHFLHAPGP
jgi:biopolymer transport protein ExbB/TolQ